MLIHQITACKYSNTGITNIKRTSGSSLGAMGALAFLIWALVERLNLRALVLTDACCGARYTSLSFNFSGSMGGIPPSRPLVPFCNN